MFLTAQTENITNVNIDKVTKEDVIARLAPNIELANKTGFPSESIVMKMTKFRLNDREPWMDVIKISDDAGKHMGNEKLIEMAKYQLGTYLKR